MKKNVKLFLSIALLAAFISTSLGLTAIAVKSIKLNVAGVKITVGKTYKLKVNFTPENATNKKVVFSTENKNIASVSSTGYIKGIKPGKTTITVTSASNNKAVAKCNVTIIALKAYFPLAKKITPTYLTFPMWNKTTKPFSESPFVKQLSKLTNIEFKWQQMESSSQLIEKQKIIIASGDFPDIMQLILGPDVSEAGKAGLLVNFTKYLDKMPNFVKYLKKDNSYAQYIEPDGAIYQLREMNFDRQPMGMMAYRKDLFEKHNLKADSWEDLYLSLKKLKELYPDSTPVSNITSYGFTDLGWDYFGVRPGYYNDPYTNELKYGPIDEYDRFKFVINWYKKLWDDKLLHPDFFSMSTEATQEAWIAGKSFWSAGQPDPYAWETGRVVEKKIPGAKVRALPYIATGSKKDDKYGFFDAGSSVAWWYSVIINAKSKYVEQLIRFIDLQFSDDIRISQYNGIKGVSWDYDKDGKVYRIKPYDQADKANELADFIGPFMSRCLVSVNETKIEDPMQIERLSFFKKYEPYYAKYPFNIDVKLSDKEKEDINQITTDLDTFTKENIVKFIIGDRPMTQWDNFIQELKDMGAEKVLKNYQDNKVNKIAVYNKVITGIK